MPILCRVSSVIFNENDLSGPPNEQTASVTDRTVEIPAGLVLVSIGYVSVRLCCVHGLSLIRIVLGCF